MRTPVKFGGGEIINYPKKFFSTSAQVSTSEKLSAEGPQCAWSRKRKRHVQDRCPGLSMSSRPSTVVLVRRLPACLRLPTAPSPVIRFTVVCRSTCTQHVWWPVLCHCRAAGL